jgi:hypothetical protein
MSQRVVYTILDRISLKTLARGTGKMATGALEKQGHPEPAEQVQRLATRARSNRTRIAVNTVGDIVVAARVHGRR